MTGFSLRNARSVGGWLAVLTHSHRRDARRRWPRRAAYALLAQAVAAAIVILGIRDALVAQAMLGLLFPVAVWAAVSMWRVMTTCSLIAVALEDVVVSVMLGLPVMALLVWLPDRLDCRDIEVLADALHIPPAGIASARETLRLAGKYVELPQRWWIGLYVVLVAVSVLLAVRPGLLPVAMQWLPRLQFVPSPSVDHRDVTATHLALPNALNARPATAHVAPLYGMPVDAAKANRPALNQPHKRQQRCGGWRWSGQWRCVAAQLV